MGKKEFDCGIIVSTMIPAVRIRVAEILDSKYGYTQKDIADKLGVVQVAVSKYLNKKYSKAVEKMKENLSAKIEKDKLVENIIKSSNSDEVNYKIERFCENAV